MSSHPHQTANIGNSPDITIQRKNIIYTGICYLSHQ